MRLLHVTQLAVTQTLQHAELQPGYALFTRQRNRLVPTSEAQMLYPEVQKLVSQLESVRRLAGGMRAGERAELRLLIVPSLAVRALPDALKVFRHRHPDVAVSVHTLHSNEITQAIALREGDVGIVYGSTQHPALQQVPIATGRLVCVSQPAARGPARRSTVELAEQGFGPAIIDSFTAAASTNEALEMRTLLPEVRVIVQALLPHGERSPQPAADLIEAFKAIAGASAA